MADTELTGLFTNAITNGLEHGDIKEVADLHKKALRVKNIQAPRNVKTTLLVVSLIVILLALQVPKTYRNKPLLYLKQTFHNRVFNPQGKCLIMNSDVTVEITRKPARCEMCEGTTEVPIVYNMTKEYFLKHHAYNGKPVLFKGGVKHWSALETFSFDYFKKVYDKEALEEFDNKECQFFGYKTNFRTLEDVFHMSKKRQMLKKDQWYIGWSNCVERIQTKLRKHYERPTFLPDDSESSSLDWIFMGGSGTGAMMHIDGVNRPSWQAMIKGSKTWYIEAPPECFTSCPRVRMNATMEQGDILIVDTNKWYHSTFIHPGGLSITIGSEYD